MDSAPVISHRSQNVKPKPEPVSVIRRNNSTLSNAATAATDLSQERTKPSHFVNDDVIPDAPARAAEITVATTPDVAPRSVIGKDVANSSTIVNDSATPVPVLYAAVSSSSSSTEVDTVTVTARDDAAIVAQTAVQTASVGTQYFIQLYSSETQTDDIEERVEIVATDTQATEKPITLESTTQTETMVEPEELNPTPDSQSKESVSIPTIEHSEDALSALKAENMRLLQDLEAIKLMLESSQAQASQMKILKEAAEARFEQLARVAHRKLVRAMVEK